MNDIEISVIVSIVTGVVAVAGFSFSRRKERDEDIKRQTTIDVMLQEITKTLREIREDITAIKETSTKHDTRIHQAELKIGLLEKQFEKLEKAMRR